MKSITQEQFNNLLQATSAISLRAKQALRFIASTTSIASDDWSELELVPISDKTGTKGVLLLAPDTDIFVLAYELSRGAPNHTGRIQPIICDFCKTWQTGGNSGRITFRKHPRSNNSVTFLCCADLACSSHVRTKTNASLQSRAQLRENLTNDQRVGRLKVRLRVLVDDMGLA
jgi:hypothetical protein